MSDENATVTTQEPAQPERTFTQDDVNAIVQKRLAEERGKYADYEALKTKAEKFDAAEEAAKTELQKAQEKASALQEQIDMMTKADNIRKVREKVSLDKKIPASLLSGTTEEECIEQADAILAFAKPAGYPKVRDGGEPQKLSSGDTRDQFSDWFNSQIQGG